MAGKTISFKLMQAALDAADPVKAITNQLRVRNGSLVVRDRVIIENLQKFTKTYVFGAGKASSQMARAICMVDNFKIHGGLVIIKNNHASTEDLEVCQKQGIRVAEASHPIPCDAGARATKEIIRALSEIDNPSTLVIWLASGGGSALTGGVGVTPELTLDALKESMQWLLDSGADIEQVNAIRKHLCLAHGGRIGAILKHSTMVTLVVSDIIGSPLDAIAGGPTTPDPTTIEDCRLILNRLSKGGRQLASPLQTAFFSSKENGKLVPETPKTLIANILPGIVLVDLDLAINSAEQLCKSQYPKASVLKLTSRLSGEAGEVGRLLSRIATDINLPKPLILLAGGESTVTMDTSKSGLGGRNQELALSAAVALFEDKQAPSDLHVLVIGTDGTDGPTDAAGAVVSKNTINGQTIEAARFALQNHDSYNFFRKHAPNAHIKTGPTGTNVMDVIIICSGFDQHQSQLL